jgi:putative ABC transport system permease protein
MGAPVIQPGLVFVTIGLGIGVTLLAGLLPAFSASRVTPLEALRPSVSETVQRTARAGVWAGIVLIILAGLGLASHQESYSFLGCLLFLLGIIMVAPALVKPIATVFSRLVALAFARQGIGNLAQNNLIRHPSRSAVTASATMIGIAIIVGVVGMVWSLMGNFMNILERSLGSDYLIMPPSVAVWGSNVGAKQILADKLRGVPGVEVVSSLRYAAGSVNKTSVSVLGIDPKTYPKVASLTFQEGNQADSFSELASGRTLIANGVFAATAGVKAGDTVQLSTPKGVQNYKVVAVAGDYLNVKVLTIYISQDNLRNDFNKNEDIFFQINLAPGADARVAEDRFNKILSDYPQFKLVSGANYLEQSRQLFSVVFLFYFVLLAVLALPSLLALLNTLAIGVIERTREIGMLRAIGATRKQVRSMVVAESILLAAIGTAFGMIAGLYLGYVMVLGLSSSGYPVEYDFPYAGLLVALATGLLFGAIAGVLPARQAARMEIVNALRYE